MVAVRFDGCYRSVILPDTLLVLDILTSLLKLSLPLGWRRDESHRPVPAFMR
jgi:hypothetical protein